MEERSDRRQDERVIQYRTDRSQKVSAAESVQPHGKFRSPEEGLAEFGKARGETIEWVRGTQVDLRDHGVSNPTFGFLDAYGYLLFLSAHSARLTAQIEEVKAAAGYPR